MHACISDDDITHLTSPLPHSLTCILALSYAYTYTHISIPHSLTPSLPHSYLLLVAAIARVGEIIKTEIRRYGRSSAEQRTEGPEQGGAHEDRTGLSQE